MEDSTIYFVWLVIFMVIALASKAILTAEFVDWCEESEWVQKQRENWDSYKTASLLQGGVLLLLVGWLIGVFADMKVEDAEMGGVFSATAAIAIILVNLPLWASREKLYGDETPEHIRDIATALRAADDEMLSQDSYQAHEERSLVAYLQDMDTSVYWSAMVRRVLAC